MLSVTAGPAVSPAALAEASVAAALASYAPARPEDRLTQRVYGA